MKRLTKKHDSKEGTTIGMPKAVKCYWKLKELEDIEDKLYIDLITLFKILEQGYIWVREQNTEENEIVLERIRLNYPNGTLDFIEPRQEIGIGRNICGYGKSYALTKEELE